MNADDLARRAFLRRASRLALAGTAMPFGLNLAAIGEAAAFQATDYKALVCVFLYGGNDHANTLVAYDAARHDRYRAIRAAGGVPGIAIERDALASTVLLPGSPLADGAQYALHPNMGALGQLFNSGKAGVLLNVGPLIAPTTKTQYFSADRTRYPIPPKLFSHNDQSSVWQASDPEGATRGWGGRIGDLALNANGQSMFTCISATGGGVFVSGDASLRYQVTTQGAVGVRVLQSGPFGGAGMVPTLRELMTEPRGHVLENEYNKITKRSIDAESRVSSALAGATVTTRFPLGGSLSDELAIVARLIAARSALGVKRQVFLCSLLGFDHHDNLVERLPGLLAQVSESIAAFYRATVELGVADQVTTFTGSDFGRALSSNGNGTDHGWGN
ncbi:MAG: DUF1501 domain-containing protein, partial [Burkholderiales bacterium]|nr:DUF1501 domain-containing protein [Burkholderiales bacterium]